MSNHKVTITLRRSGQVVERGGSAKLRGDSRPFSGSKRSMADRLGSNAHGLSFSTSKQSTLHRVVGNGQERYSIAYFIEPSHDCLVECLPTCKSEKDPPKFPPILCRTYLSQRYYDTHVNLNVYNEDNS